MLLFFGIILGVFVYTFFVALTIQICIKLDIGVLHYTHTKDDYFNAFVIGAFWFVTLPYIIMYYLSKGLISKVLQYIKNQKIYRK